MSANSPVDRGRVLARSRAKTHPFWDSEEGERYRDGRRALEMLHLSVEAEVPSKNVRSREKAAQFRAQLAEGADEHQALQAAARLGVWPRPRAPLAVDLHFQFASKQPPRVDTASKALLDMLGGQTGRPIAYTDDRQIKMLFARTFMRAEGERSGHTRVRVRTLHNSVDAVRRASELTPSWDPLREGRHALEDIYDGPDWDWNPEWALRSDVNVLAKRQGLFLRIADERAWRTVRALSGELTRQRVLAWTTDAALQELASARLAVNLGPLPGAGDSTAFRKRVQEQLTAMATSSLGLFPLLPAVGVTVFYVESAKSRDLDNIHVTLLKDVLSTLKPLARPMGMWSPVRELEAWDQARKGLRPSAPAGVTFIEALAVPPQFAPSFDPGTVILALSDGSRYSSWWDDAHRHIDQVARYDYDEEAEIDW